MRFLVILMAAVMLFAQNLEDIVKKISKDSPSYSLDMALVQKIKSIKYTPYKFNASIKNQDDFVNSFYSLVILEEDNINLPQKIENLKEKISLLKEQNSTTAELQKILYQKTLDIYKKKYQFLQKNIPVYEKKLYNELLKINFDVKKAQNDLEDLKKLLKQRKKEYEKLKIDLQKWELLNNKTKLAQTKALIEKNLQYQEKIYTKIFKKEVVLWAEALKRKDKNAFKLSEELLKTAKNISEDFYEASKKIVEDFEKFAFGNRVLVYNSKKEIQNGFEKIWKLLNYPLFKVDKRVITPINFFVFVLVIILGWFIGKYYKKLIYSLRHKYEISYATATLLANMGYYTIITLSFLIALKIVGLDLSSLAIIAGALSVGIGFGLQNIVSNFVSGIILMFERSVKVGDYIQIDENTRGEVVDISMRSTIIRTNDNINLIIPNQNFIQNNVINWTLGDDIVRFSVPFGVAYGSDIDKVERVILNAVKNSKVHYIKKHHSLDVEPRVVFLEMGDSSLNFELLVWVRGEYARRPRRTRSEFLKVIYKALNQAGIEIPFPQQDLHIKDSVPFEIKIKKSD